MLLREAGWPGGEGGVTVWLKCVLECARICVPACLPCLPACLLPACPACPACLLPASMPLCMC